MVPGKPLALPQECRGRGQGRAVTRPLRFLTVKPGSIFRGGRWTIRVHQVVSDSREETGSVFSDVADHFCSILNEEKVPQAISLKVGPAHLRVHARTRIHTHTHTDTGTHLDTPHEREKKKTDAKNKRCLLTAQVKIKSGSR